MRLTEDITGVMIAGPHQAVAGAMRLGGEGAGPRGVDTRRNALHCTALHHIEIIAGKLVAFPFL